MRPLIALRVQNKNIINYITYSYVLGEHLSVHIIFFMYRHLKCGFINYVSISCECVYPYHSYHRNPEVPIKLCANKNLALKVMPLQRGQKKPEGV